MRLRLCRRSRRPRRFSLVAPAFGSGRGNRRRGPADGQPDLQGVWNFSTITPLERPAEFAGPGNFSRRGGSQNSSSRRTARARATATPRKPRVPTPGRPPSAYNEVSGWDRGRPCGRGVNGKGAATSLVVDPPEWADSGADRGDGQSAPPAGAPPTRDASIRADGPEDRGARRALPAVQRRATDAVGSRTTITCRFLQTPRPPRRGLRAR